MDPTPHMKSSPDAGGQLRFEAVASRLKQGGAALGVVALGVAVWLGMQAGDGGRRFFHAYLWAWAYFLSIGLGALFFVTLQHLTRAGWSVVVRRIAEYLAATLPVMALLFLPILVAMLQGNSTLYSWVDPQKVAADALLRGKSGYLNVTFFAIRFGIYALVWTTLSQLWLRQSLAQDSSGDVTITHRMQQQSAPAMFVVALSLTFCAFDTLMSLEPHWFSTMFGVYFFAGSVLSFLATTIIIARLLHDRGIVANVLTTEHFHDLGKLLFGFVFFWGYVAFSQYMLIWYANIPEETEWIIERKEGGWWPLSLALLFGHFVLPFPGLISRHVKRHRVGLGFWAVFLLIMHAVDLYWLVMPSLHDPAGPRLGAMELACWTGMLGLFVATFAFFARGHALVPRQDPRLAESLAFENA